MKLIILGNFSYLYIAFTGDLNTLENIQLDELDAYLNTETR